MKSTLLVRGKFLRTFLSLIVALLIFTNPLSAYAEQLYVDKDETVYTMLNYDGSVQYTQVVNRLYEITDSTAQDFADFLEVKPLSPSTLISQADGQLSWDTSHYIGEDFYYQGTIVAELPILLEFKYTLDGASIDPRDLGGKSGQLTLDMTITQNPNCQTSLQNIYLTQLQLLLDLDLVTIIDAPDSTSTVAGKFTNVTYTVLPSDSKTYQLVMDVKDFKMEPMSIALIKYNMSATGDISALTEGLSSANDGFTQLINGTSSLQDGLSDMVEGFSIFNEGLLQLSTGASALNTGMKRYKNGLTEFKSGTQTLSTGLNQTYTGLSSLNENGTTLSANLNQLSGGLTQLQTGHSELVTLANSLLTSSDPMVVALAQGIIAENSALLELSSGLSLSAGGLTSFTSGLDALTTGLFQINQGVAQLPIGMEGLINGFDTTYLGYTQIASGLEASSVGGSTVYDNIVVLPSAASEIVKGQNALSDGLVQMKEEVEIAFSSKEDQPVYSFANETAQIHSLQFVLKTPAIELQDVLEVEITDEKETVGLFGQFIERLKVLFN